MIFVLGSSIFEMVNRIAQIIKWNLDGFEFPWHKNLVDLVNLSSFIDVRFNLWISYET